VALFIIFEIGCDVYIIILKHPTNFEKVEKLTNTKIKTNVQFFIRIMKLKTCSWFLSLFILQILIYVSCHTHYFLF